MASWTRPGLLITLLLAVGCTDKEEPNFGKSGTGGGDGGADDTGETADGGGTSSDGGTGDGGAEGDEGFDEPGDIVEYEDEGGEAVVGLSDASGDSNQDQQFYMVLVNSEDTPLSYQVRYDSTGSSSAPPPQVVGVARPSPARRLDTSDFRHALREGLRAGDIERVSAPALPPPPFSDADIGVTEREFRVRDSLVSDASYSTSSATLWGIGDTVAIWVDAGVPIDWDIECDGVVDVEAQYEAYGFDNCDLQIIADIVDTNIVPNLRRIFGEESDVNGDGLVSVLITPELNVISYTSDDEDEQGGLVGSYADPEVDLNDWSATTNPGSDEQEIIYVFAPDPYGFLNPSATATVDEYTSMELAAQIARSFFSLISYNQHVVVAEGSAEEDWLNQGLGALAADLTGFGAVYYADAWDYVDASHLQPLVENGDNGALSTDPVGAQYLFARWLYDAFGEEKMAELVQVGTGDGGGTGTDGDGGTTDETGDTETQDSTTGVALVESVFTSSFDDLVVQWQVALLTTGVELDDGTALVDSESWPAFQGATTLTAPTSGPSPGDYYGANGYQQGIELRDVNRYMEGGTSNSPVENANNRVTLGGSDFTTAVTGIENWGYVDGGYSAQVFRLTDITIDNAYLKVQGSATGFVGAVVRWTDVDPLRPDTVVEQIFSPTKADNIDLPVLPTDGSPVYGVGEITGPGFTTIQLDDGSSESGPVYDTDRWLLSLSDHTVGEDVAVAIHLTRHYTSSAGDVAPFDPWLSVVPQTWIPTPTVEGTQRGSCPEGIDFQYPSTMLEYLYYQLFLSQDYGEDTSDVGEEGYSCGEISADTTCGEDWDRDGILDVDELMPTTYVDQVNAMLCTLHGNDASLFTPVTVNDLLDIDTLDEDELSWYSRAKDLGGMADSSGEEAFLKTTLEGGGEYLIIVGAGTYAGSYELEVKQID